MKYYIYEGKPYSTEELAKIAGIPHKTMYNRLVNKKWDVEKAIKMPFNGNHDGKFTSSDTLCWTCKNAAGGCEWSLYCIHEHDTPEVPGWDAEPKYMKTETSKTCDFGYKDTYPNENSEKGTLTYLVKACPKYVKD